MIEGLFQPMHLIVIAAIALVVMGPGKLPELGAGLGKAIREFKKAMDDAGKPAIQIGSAEVKKEEETETSTKSV